MMMALRNGLRNEKKVYIKEAVEERCVIQLLSENEHLSQLLADRDVMLLGYEGTRRVG